MNDPPPSARELRAGGRRRRSTTSSSGRWRRSPTTASTPPASSAARRGGSARDRRAREYPAPKAFSRGREAGPARRDECRSPRSRACAARRWSPYAISRCRGLCLPFAAQRRRWGARAGQYPAAVLLADRSPWAAVWLRPSRAAALLVDELRRRHRDRIDPDRPARSRVADPRGNTTRLPGNRWRTTIWVSNSDDGTVTQDRRPLESCRRDDLVGWWTARPRGRRGRGLGRGRADNEVDPQSTQSFNQASDGASGSASSPSRVAAGAGSRLGHEFGRQHPLQDRSRRAPA